MKLEKSKKGMKPAFVVRGNAGSCNGDVEYPRGYVGPSAVRITEQDSGDGYRLSLLQIIFKQRWRNGDQRFFLHRILAKVSL